MAYDDTKPYSTAFKIKWKAITIIRVETHFLLIFVLATFQASLNVSELSPISGIRKNNFNVSHKKKIMEQIANIKSTQTLKENKANKIKNTSIIRKIKAFSPTIFQKPAICFCLSAKLKVFDTAKAVRKINKIKAMIKRITSRGFVIR